MVSRRSYYVVLPSLIYIFTMLMLVVFGISYSCFANVIRNSNICRTKSCLNSATLLSRSMNKSVNPCMDFYEFACGNYSNSFGINKNDTNDYNHYSMVQYTLIRDISKVLEKDVNNTESSAIAKLRKLYRSCMATDQMNLVGIQTLVKLLNSMGLPTLIGYSDNNSTKNNEQNLSSILANIKKKINLNYFFSTSVGIDNKNLTINRISLAKPDELDIFTINKSIKKIKKMSLRKMRKTLDSEEKLKNENEYSVNDLFKKSFENYFHHVWLELYSFQTNNSNHPKLLIKIEELLRINHRLLNITNTVYASDNESPIIMNVDELQSYTNNITESISKTRGKIIDWRQYFTILFMDINDVKLDFKTHLIQISNIEYFKALFELLVELPKSNIITNIWWEVVTTLLPFTTNSMRFAQDRFHYELTGKKINISRSENCAIDVKEMMGVAVNRLLINKKLNDSNKQKTIEMIENIHWAFEKIVKDLKWMDDTTKQRTLNKSQKIKTIVGYHEFINENKLLDEYYSDFEIIENNYFANVIHYIQLDLNNTLESLVELNDFNLDIKNIWTSDPLEVNAHNALSYNAIIIPNGILRFPFFGHDLQVLNYGFLGYTFGHELTHGFDTTGRKYDQDGNENMWWTNKTIQEYEKRTDCFIHQYESYLLPGIKKKINGTLTLDENIADNGGLRQAFLAYRKFVADHGEESKLPGLEDFSNEQIYYLAFANSNCEALSYKSLSDDLLLDVHSPNYIRVIGGLANSEEFSEIWKCEKGTTMNPTNEKCKIW